MSWGVGTERQPENPLPDANLIASIRAGDAAAERALYDAHVDRIYRLAYRMTGDATLAEDATQDTFIRAFARLDEFRGDGAFGGWLHRIATTVVLGHLRRRKRVRTWEHADDELVPVRGRRARRRPVAAPPPGPGRGRPGRQPPPRVRDARHGRLHAPGDRRGHGHARGHGQGAAQPRPRPVARSAPGTGPAGRHGDGKERHERP